ncbi:hypothetical protein [Undibacterium sp. TJN19]|uniref:hypothetical protein n=1 Tax=Undibacterium sp. TJN19 TaxID=3413055 RepID=UPI003BF3AFAD
MKNSTKKNILRTVILSGFVGMASCLSYANAQENRELTSAGEPARWFQEEMTPLAYFKTLKKEAEAVYQESAMDCKRMDSARRNECLRAAKNTLQQDMAAARQKSGYQGR